MNKLDLIMDLDEDIGVINCSHSLGLIGSQIDQEQGHRLYLADILVGPLDFIIDFFLYLFLLLVYYWQVSEVGNLRNLLILGWVICNVASVMVMLQVHSNVVELFQVCVNC